MDNNSNVRVENFVLVVYAEQIARSLNRKTNLPPDPGISISVNEKAAYAVTTVEIRLSSEDKTVKVWFFDRGKMRSDEDACFSRWTIERVDFESESKLLSAVRNTVVSDYPDLGRYFTDVPLVGYVELRERPNRRIDLHLRKTDPATVPSGYDLVGNYRFAGLQQYLVSQKLAWASRELAAKQAEVGDLVREYQDSGE